MSPPQSTENDLRQRLHNYGTAEWIRRCELNEMLRVAQGCVDALDEIERLSRQLWLRECDIEAGNRVLSAVCESSVNGREVLQGIDKGVADLVRYRLGLQVDVPAKACPPDDHMYVAAAGSEIGEGTCAKCGEKEPADDPEQGTRQVTHKGESNGDR